MPKKYFKRGYQTRDRRDKELITGLRKELIANKPKENFKERVKET